MMKFHLEPFLSVEYIPDDPTTHRINYIESIMLPNGRLFFLTLGAHPTNMMYMVEGVRNVYDIKDPDRLDWYLKSDPGTMMVDLAEETGLIPIFNQDYAIAPRVTKKQALMFAELYTNGHVSLMLYKQMRAIYFRDLKEVTYNETATLVNR